MKRGQRHAPPQPKPAPEATAPVIPPHIAALGIVKSVRPDSSYVCIHNMELTECDECAPIALLADEEASVSAASGVEIAGTQEEGVGSLGALPPIEESPKPATCAPALDGPRDTAASGQALMSEESMPEALSVACAALGLASEHVRKHTPLGEGRCRILTHGGTSITWPDDRDKYTATPLTLAQKDGIVRSKAHIPGLLGKASEAARDFKAEPL